MRNILVDHARSHGRQKRGCGAQLVPLDEAAIVGGDDIPELLELAEALERPAPQDSRKSQIIELLFDVQVFEFEEEDHDAEAGFVPSTSVETGFVPSTSSELQWEGGLEPAGGFSLLSRRSISHPDISEVPVK